MMKKMITILAATCLAPALAFGAGQCTKMTDDQYREIITSQPISQSFSQDGLNIVLTATFHKNSTFDVHMDLHSPMGNGALDFGGNWRVTNAVLYTHISHATHTQSQSQEMNQALDQAVAEIKANPDNQVSLDSDCDSPSRAARALFAR